MFFGSDKGGQTAAILFSMTRSAKRCGLNMFTYIEDVLTRLPGHPVNKLYELLPDQWAKSLIKKSSQVRYTGKIQNPPDAYGKCKLLNS